MKKLLLVLPLVILFSCSVQKRHYQKGFYFSSNKSKNSVKKEKIVTTRKEIKSEHLTVKSLTTITGINNKLEASAEKKTHLI